MAKRTDSKQDGTQMVHMRFDETLLKRLDDFRFKNRIESRSESIRWLLDWGLSQKPSVPKKEE
jgi:metal-responsive CopG/Arc/MetJ family transcriptional regulator